MRQSFVSECSGKRAFTLEKLGNSHQMPHIDPLFVYFRLFNIPLSPFFSGFMACFYSFQKCHILGCWNFNVFYGVIFVIILQQHLFSLQESLGYTKHPFIEATLRVNAISGSVNSTDPWNAILYKRIYISFRHRSSPLRQHTLTAGLFFNLRIASISSAAFL